MVQNTSCNLALETTFIDNKEYKLRLLVNGNRFSNP